MNSRYITMTYAPTEEAKEIYGKMIAEPGWNTIPINAGSLSDDEWFLKNGTLETSSPDNIADRNGSWCELTTVYWIWKNNKLMDDDWVEHDHYRRFLVLPEGIDKMGFDILTAPPFPMVFNVPDGKGGRTNVQTDIEGGMKICHPHLLWNVLEDTLTSNLKWSGQQLWDSWRRSNQLYAPYQMWRMKKPAFVEYCEWMFPLLEQMAEVLDKKVKSDKWRGEFSNAYQSRYMGFIGERMFSWWVYAQHMGGQHRVGMVDVKTYENFKPFTAEDERNTKKEI